MPQGTVLSPTLFNIYTADSPRNNECQVAQYADDTVIFTADINIENAYIKLQNYFNKVKSRRLRWAGHVAHMEQSRNAYRVLVGKPEGKRPLGRPRRRWEDNIKIDLREVGCDPGEWIDLAEDRDQWTAYVSEIMNLRVP